MSSGNVGNIHFIRTGFPIPVFQYLFKMALGQFGVGLFAVGLFAVGTVRRKKKLTEPNLTLFDLT